MLHPKPIHTTSLSVLSEMPVLVLYPISLRLAITFFTRRLRPSSGAGMTSLEITFCLQILLPRATLAQLGAADCALN